MSHYSISQINMWFRCGMQWQFRYQEGIKRPPRVAMLIGGGTHVAIEKNLLNKRDTGALLDVEAVKDFASEAVTEKWAAEEPELSPEEREQGTEKTKGRAIDTAVTLATLHHEIVAPEITPIHVEREWTLDVTGYPFQLTGYIDVQEATKVRDTKTASRKPNKDVVKHSHQLTLYSLAVKCIDGVAPQTVHLDTLVDGKEAVAVCESAERGPDDYADLLNRLAVMHTAIEKGVFIPAERGAWICSEKWCGYWDMCPYGRKGRTSHV